MALALLLLSSRVAFIGSMATASAVLLELLAAVVLVTRVVLVLNESIDVFSLGGGMFSLSFASSQSILNLVTRGCDARIFRLICRNKNKSYNEVKTDMGG